MPAQIIPLYLRQSPPALYAYESEKHELLRFDNNSMTPDASLALKKDMRLLQQNEKFGVMTVDEAARKIHVKVIKAWSGDSFLGYEVPLPELWNPQTLAAGIDFASGTLVVYGSTPSYRRELRQALVYDVSKGAVVRLVSASPRQYLSQVSIDPKGRRLLLLSRSLEHDEVQGLRIYDIKNGEWRELSLTQEINPVLETEESK